MFQSFIKFNFLLFLVVGAMTYSDALGEENDLKRNPRGMGPMDMNYSNEARLKTGKKASI
jgi:hypothetical protein